MNAGNDALKTIATEFRYDSIIELFANRSVPKVVRMDQATFDQLKNDLPKIDAVKPVVLGLEVVIDNSCKTPIVCNKEESHD